MGEEWAGDECRGMGMMSVEVVQLGISFVSQGPGSQLCDFGHFVCAGLH